VFGSIVAFSAYVWLLSHTSATRISTHTYVNPVIAVILGWALAGESLTLATILATAVIIVSIYLVLSDRSHKPIGGEKSDMVLAGSVESPPQ
jgi:drug/metabolite transporter (DMT)-like permease